MGPYHVEFDRIVRTPDSVVYLTAVVIRIRRNLDRFAALANRRSISRQADSRALIGLRCHVER